MFDRFIKHACYITNMTWKRFWNWYEKRILGSILIIAIIQFIQIPHMVWNADLYLEYGHVSRLHPVLDFFFYGIDLIEVVSIVNIGMILYALVRKRIKKNKGDF